jgi:hypothetical protein
MKDVVADNPQTTKISTTVALQSLFPAQLKYIGLSGKEYRWEKAGDVVHVLEEDAPTLLSKKHIHRGCCGVYSEGNVLFQLYKEAVNA